jgi:hypothetical protein
MNLNEFLASAGIAFSYSQIKPLEDRGSFILCEAGGKTYGLIKPKDGKFDESASYKVSKSGKWLYDAASVGKIAVDW